MNDSCRDGLEAREAPLGLGSPGLAPTCRAAPRPCLVAQALQALLGDDLGDELLLEVGSSAYHQALKSTA